MMTPSATPQIDAVLDGLMAGDGAAESTSTDAPPIFPTSIPSKEGEALSGWVEREAAERTIEVGLGYAVSALYIGRALRASENGATHVAIDPHQSRSFANRGIRSLDEAGLSELIEFYEEESQIVLPRLVSDGRTFDLAFVDGNHRFDRVFLDLIFLGRLVRPGGVVFVDDYQLPSIERAVSFCVTNLGWSVEELSSRDGLHQWIVLRTSTAPDERPFDHFVSF